MTTPNFTLTTQITAPLSTHEFLGVTYKRHETSASSGSGRWGLLGGTVLFEASNEFPKDGEYHAIRIQFHGGRNCWMLEDERHSPIVMHPRNDIFGSLHNIMKEFETRTGLTLPSVQIQEVGIGISDISAKAVSSVAGNPWHLQPGADYEIVQVVGTCGERKVRQFHVAENAFGRYSVTFPNEPSHAIFEAFDPYVIFSGEDWLNLKLIAPADQPAPGLSDQPSS